MNLNFNSIEMSLPYVSLEAEKQHRELYGQLQEIGIERGFLGRENEHPHGPVVELVFAERSNWTAMQERSIMEAVHFVLNFAIKSGDLGAHFAMRRLDEVQKAERARRSVDAMPKAAGVRKVHLNGSQDEAAAARDPVRRRRSQRPQQLMKKSPRERAAIIRAVLFAIAQANSKWKDDAADWYRAALLTGVSPQEWRAGTLVDCGRGRHALCIDVAGDSDQIGRILPLDRLTGEQLELVCGHLNKAAAYAKAGGFDGWFDACRKLLRTEVLKFWPIQDPLPTLQATRYLLASTPCERLSALEISAVREA